MTDAIVARIAALCEEAEKRRMTLRRLQSAREAGDRHRALNRVLKGRKLWALRVILTRNNNMRERVLQIAERARQRRNLKELQPINQELAAAISRVVADELGGVPSLPFPRRKAPGKTQ